MFAYLKQIYKNDLKLIEIVMSFLKTNNTKHLLAQTYFLFLQNYT